MTRNTILTAILAAASGVGTFYLSRSIAAPVDDSRTSARGRAPLARWLDLDTDRAATVQAADRDFEEEASELSVALDRERAALVELLEDPTTPDERILSQVESVIGAHSALERRAARHLVRVRNHLTIEQQKRLLGFLADTVREARGRMARRRGWTGGSPPGGRHGQGRGRRHGGGHGGQHGRTDDDGTSGGRRRQRRMGRPDQGGD